MSQPVPVEQTGRRPTASRSEGGVQSRGEIPQPPVWKIGWRNAPSTKAEPRAGRGPRRWSPWSGARGEPCERGFEAATEDDRLDCRAVERRSRISRGRYPASRSGRGGSRARRVRPAEWSCVRHRSQPHGRHRRAAESRGYRAVQPPGARSRATNRARPSGDPQRGQTGRGPDEGRDDTPTVALKCSSHASEDRVDSEERSGGRATIRSSR